MAATVSCVPLQAIPVSNTNGVLVTGPCIVLKATTVAQQVQALRPKVAGSEEKDVVLRCKRKIDFAKLGVNPPKAGAVSRRNERERNRVKLVNNGFEVLREHVPCIKKNKKLSKVETLRRAVEYIKVLQQMIEESDSYSDSHSVGFTDSESLTSNYTDCSSLSPSLPPQTPTSPESTFQNLNLAPMTSPSQDSLIHSPTPSLSSSSSDTSYDSLSSSLDDDILDFWINNEIYAANFTQDLNMHSQSMR